MGICLPNGNKTELRPGDRIAFNVKAKTIFFARSSLGKLYIKVDPKEKKVVEFDKVIAPFIQSEDDFVSFASFLTNFFALTGVRVEKSGEILLWEFIHKDSFIKKIVSGTRIEASKDYSLITFQSPCKTLRQAFSVPFIKSGGDFIDLLLIISHLTDFKMQFDDDKAFNKRIFV